MKFGQNRAVDMDDVKARRKAEEQYRNQKAHVEAQKAELMKKQRKIQECQEQIQRMDRYAERCLLDGQEGKASVYLERKVEWQNRLSIMIEEAGFTVTEATVSETVEMTDEEPHDDLGQDVYGTE